MQKLASSNIRDSCTDSPDAESQWKTNHGNGRASYTVPSICLSPENPAQPGLPVPLSTAKPTLCLGIDQNGALYVKSGISEEPRQAKPCGTQTGAMDREGSKDAQRNLGCSVAKRQSVPNPKTFTVSQVERFPDMVQTTLLQFG